MCYSRAGVIIACAQERVRVQFDCGKSLVIEHPSELVLVHREFEPAEA